MITLAVALIIITVKDSTRDEIRDMVYTRSSPKLPSNVDFGPQNMKVWYCDLRDISSKPIKAQRNTAYTSNSQEKIVQVYSMTKIFLQLTL